jgi:hypothetical protein
VSIVDVTQEKADKSSMEGSHEEPGNRNALHGQQESQQKSEASTVLSTMEMATHGNVKAANSNSACMETGIMSNQSIESR